MEFANETHQIVHDYDYQSITHIKMVAYKLGFGCCTYFRNCMLVSKIHVQKKTKQENTTV